MKWVIGDPVFEINAKVWNVLSSLQKKEFRGMTRLAGHATWIALLLRLHQMHKFKQIEGKCWENQNCTSLWIPSCDQFVITRQLWNKHSDCIMVRRRLKDLVLAVVGATIVLLLLLPQKSPKKGDQANRGGCHLCQRLSWEAGRDQSGKTHSSKCECWISFDS